MHSDIALEFLTAPGFLGSERETLALKRNPAEAEHAQAPTLIWCGGLKSDMEGGKATHLQDWALAHGRAFIRFDYFGHGKSSGNFMDAGISRWARDTVQIIDEVAGEGDVILIGSSMGGWAALLAALDRPQRVVGLLLIAPAPDFTQDLMWDHFGADIRKQIEDTGLYLEPSEYGDPMPISKTLIEDGRNHLLLNAPIAYLGPVRILQGVQDVDVPFAHAQRLIKALESEDVEMTLVKSGDHRLSSATDLRRLSRALEDLLAHVQGSHKDV